MYAFVFVLRVAYSVLYVMKRREKSKRWRTVPQHSLRKKTEAMLCFFFSYFTLLTDITKDPNSVLHHTHSFQLWFHTLYTLRIFHNYDAYVLDLLLFALALVLVSPFRRVFSFLNGLYAVFIHFRSIWWCNEEESTMRATLLCVLFNKKVPFLRI